ncbi:MAG: response regulator [Planctomycetota bacterium]|nr:response regulator [Planctomycetota bacterium]MDP7251132.1 response regulator [Planctomycetota bacterium]
MRIVAVDDEPYLIDLYQNIFESIGAEVVAFQNPARAVDYLISGNKVDLEVTDWDMPGGTGGAAVEEAKKRDIFTILCSGSAHLGTASQECSRQPVIVLKKPFSPLNLLEIVRESVTEDGKNTTNLHWREASNVAGLQQPGCNY